MTAVVGDVVELDVGPVAHGGFCVARLDGLAVFVRHALPGERVRARITETRSRYARADAVGVLAASADRVAAPCPHAGPGRCGGCDWQHASLPAQRAMKAAVVREQLRRIAGLDVPVAVELLPGTDDGLGWRTRMRFAVDPDGAVGLRRHRSHDLERIDRCLIAHPAIAPLPAPGAARERARDATVSSTGEVVSGTARVRECVHGRRFTVSAGGFWQVHPGAPAALVDGVLDLLAPRAGERAVDLYAGVGLFAAFLAEAVGPTGRVVAVEGTRAAAADAGSNLADLPHAITRHARVTPGLVDRLAPYDVAVLDPPRAGAGAAVCARLAAHRPRAVAYVACDPAALARDVAAFGAAGYRLDRLRAFDAFPMTAHVECLALLTPASRRRTVAVSRRGGGGKGVLDFSRGERDYRKETGAWSTWRR